MSIKPYIRYPAKGRLRWPDFSTLLSVLAGILVGVSTLLQFTGGPHTSPQTVKPAVNPLAVAAVARTPGGAPTVDGALILTGPSNEAWFLSTSGTTTRSSFRQAAAVSLSLVAASRASLPATLVAQDVPAGASICISVFANAFDVSGPDRVCIDPTASNTNTQSWAWIMFPKSAAAGPETVAVSMSIYGPKTLPPQVPISERSRFLTIDVVRPLFDRYSTLIAAFVTALGAVVALVVKALLDHIWPAKD